MNYWEIIGKLLALSIAIWIGIKTILFLYRNISYSRGEISNLRQAVYERDVYIIGLEAQIQLLQSRLKEDDTVEDDESTLLN